MSSPFQGSTRKSYLEDDESFVDIVLNDDEEDVGLKDESTTSEKNSNCYDLQDIQTGSDEKVVSQNMERFVANTVQSKIQSVQKEMVAFTKTVTALFSIK